MCYPLSLTWHTGVLSENIYEANGHISATIKKLKMSFYVVPMNVQIQGIKACLKSKQVRVKKQKINLSSQYFSLAKPTCIGITTKKCLHSHHYGPNINDFFFQMIWYKYMYQLSCHLQVLGILCFIFLIHNITMALLSLHHSKHWQKFSYSKLQQIPIYIKVSSKLMQIIFKIPKLRKIRDY